MKDIVSVTVQIAHSLKLLVPVNDGGATAVEFKVRLFSKISGDGVPSQRAKDQLRTLPANLKNQFGTFTCSVPQQIAALEPPHEQPHLELLREERRPWPPPHHLHHHYSVIEKKKWCLVETNKKVKVVGCWLLVVVVDIFKIKREGGIHRNLGG